MAETDVTPYMEKEHSQKLLAGQCLVAAHENVAVSQCRRLLLLGGRVKINLPHSSAALSLTFSWQGL